MRACMLPECRYFFRRHILTNARFLPYIYSPYQIYSQGSDIMVMTNEDQDSAYSFYSDSNAVVIALDVHYRYAGRRGNYNLAAL